MPVSILLYQLKLLRSLHLLILRPSIHIHLARDLNQFIRLYQLSHLLVLFVFLQVKEHNHCSNCLSHLHSYRDCTSAYSCRHCGNRHHTLLHKDKRSSRSSSPAAVVTPSAHSNTATPSAADASSAQSNSITPSESVDSDNNAVLHVNTPPTALLSTALLSTAFANAKHVCYERRARALLDSGASISLITEKLASELKCSSTSRPRPSPFSLT